jgi:hypothetical protein
MPDELDDLLAEMSKITGRKSVRPAVPKIQPTKNPFDDFIQESATRHGIDPDLIRAQMSQESSFKPRAKSYKGATGLMQLMPATAQRFGVTDIYDPQQNIEAGTKYMKWLLDEFGGDVDLALAGYNAGEGAVKKYGNKIPPYRETRDYVKKIRSNYQGGGLLNNAPVDFSEADNLLSEMKKFTDGQISPQPKFSEADSLLSEMQKITGKSAETVAPQIVTPGIGETPQDVVDANAKYLSQPQNVAPQTFIPNSAVSPQEQSDLDIATRRESSAVYKTNWGQNIATPEQQRQQAEIEKNYLEYAELSGKDPKLQSTVDEFNNIQKITQEAANKENAQISAPLQPTQNAVTVSPTQSVSQPNFPTPKPNAAIVKEEDFGKTLAGNVGIDLRRKPKGMALDEFIFRSGLQGVAGKYGLTESDINRAVEKYRSQGELIQGRSDLAGINDSNLVDYLKSRNPAITFQVTREQVAAALGDEKLKEDFRKEQADNSMQLAMRDPLIVGDSTDDLQRSFNTDDRRQEIFKQRDLEAQGIDTDLYRQAEEYVRSSPTSAGTQAEVLKQYQLLKDAQLSDRTKEVLTAAGKGVKSGDFFGGSSDVASGFLGEAGQTIGDYGAGLVRPFMNLTGYGEGLYTSLQKLSGGAKVFQTAAKTDNLGGDVLQFAGQAAFDVPKYVALSALPGGAIVGFGMDAALRSSGQGKNPLEIGKETAKGMMLGAIFHSAPKIESLAEKGFLRALLPKGNLPSPDVKLASKLFGTAARIGYVGVGAGTMEKVSGASTPDAFKAGIIMALTDLAFQGQKFGEIKDLTGKVFRMRNSKTGETADVTVENGEVKLLKGEVPPEAVDAEFDLANVKDVVPDADGVYRVKGDAEIRETKSAEKADVSSVLKNLDEKDISTTFKTLTDKGYSPKEAGDLIENEIQARKNVQETAPDVQTETVKPLEIKEKLKPRDVQASAEETSLLNDYNAGAKFENRQQRDSFYEKHGANLQKFGNENAVKQRTGEAEKADFKVGDNGNYFAIKSGDTTYAVPRYDSSLTDSWLLGGNELFNFQGLKTEKSKNSFGDDVSRYSIPDPNEYQVVKPGKIEIDNGKVKVIEKGLIKVGNSPEIVDLENPPKNEISEPKPEILPETKTALPETKADSALSVGDRVTTGLINGRIIAEKGGNVTVKFDNGSEVNYERKELSKLENRNETAADFERMASKYDDAAKFADAVVGDEPLLDRSHELGLNNLISVWEKATGKTYEKETVDRWAEKPEPISDELSESRTKGGELVKKEPFEMTRDEFEALPKAYRGIRPKGNSNTGDTNLFITNDREVAKSHGAVIMEGRILDRNKLKADEEIIGFEGRELSGSESFDKGSALVDIDNFVPDKHDILVEQALKEGKTVPPEVLADYPDLAEKYKSQETGVKNKDALPDLSPTRRAELRRQKDISPEDLEKQGVKPLGTKGEQGQISYRLRRAMENKESDFLPALASVFEPDVDLADKNAANAVLDAIAESVGKDRSSQITPSDWQTILESNADRLSDSVIDTILQALHHQDEWFKERNSFVDSPELAKILEQIDFETVKEYKKIPLNLRRELRDLGNKYGKLSTQTIREAFDDAFRNVQRRIEAQSAEGADRADAEKVETEGEEIQFTKVGDKPNLMVAHNLTEGSLLFTDELGGLAMPSLAITTKNAGFENFGDITLLADKELINPKNKVPVTDADMYSPRYPTISYKLDAKRFEKAWNEVAKPFQKHYGDKIEKGTMANYYTQWYNVLSELEKDGARSLKFNTTFQAYFYDQTGRKLPESYDDFRKIYDKDIDAELEAFANDFFDDFVTKRQMFKGFTYNGNRRYAEYTLENVVKQMKSEMKEGEGFNYGAGNIRAKAAKRYRSIEQIQKDRDRIASQKELAEKKDEMNQRLMDVADHYKQFYKYDKERFGYYDNFTSALSDGIQNKNIRRELEEYGFEGIDSLKPITDYIDELVSLPTEYFEAKPQRAVNLAEFKAAVIPSDISPKAKSVLEKRRIKLYEYKRGDSASRQQAINKATDETGILFTKDFQSQAQTIGKEIAKYNRFPLERLLNSNFNIKYNKKEDIVDFDTKGGAILQKIIKEATGQDATFGGAYANKNQTNLLIDAAIGIQRQFKTAGRLKTAEKLGEVINEITSGMAYGDGDSTFVVKDSRAPLYRKYAKQEELGHRAIGRSGIRELLVDLPVSIDKKFEKPIEMQYNDFSEIGKKDELWAKHFREDAEDYFGATTDEVDSNLTNLFDALGDAGIDLEAVAKQVENISPRGQKVAEYVRNKRSGNDEPNESVRKGSGDTDAESARETRQGGNLKGTGTLEKDADRFSKLRQTGFASTGGESTSLTKAEERFVEAKLQTAPTSERDAVKLVKDKDGNLLAPNRKKSNLNENLWRTVRTPSFRNFFGDWINKPKSASKIVDENGEPRVMYHGTRQDFTSFKKEFNTSSFISEVKDPNKSLFYFTSKPSVAESYGTSIMPVFLNIREPLTSDAEVWQDQSDAVQEATALVSKERAKILEIYEKNDVADYEDLPTEAQKSVDSLSRQAHQKILNGQKLDFVGTKQDGIIFPSILDVGNENLDFSTVAVAFNPNQIKSVFNKGTFDALKDEIMFAKSYADDSKTSKAVDTALDVVSAFKSMKATGDLSAAGRQGWILSLTHPRIALQSFRKQIFSMNDKQYQKFKTNLNLHPYIEVAEESGLFLASLADESSLTEREESFMSRLFGDEGYFKNKKVEKGRRFLTYPVRKAENAYKTYLDNLRIECFTLFAKQIHQKLLRQGKTDNDSYAKELRGVARFVNYATGRGEWSSPTLNATFFSTRYWESRVQLLNPVFYGKLPPAARTLALKNMAGFVGASALLLLLWKLGGGEIVWDDPNDPNALKLKLGSYSYDVSAGLVSHLRFAARLVSLPFEKQPEQGTKADKAVYISGKYLRSKLSPAPAAAWNTISGSNFIGEPTSLKEEVLGKDGLIPGYDPIFGGGLLSPMQMNNFYEAAKADGTLGLIKVLPEFVGFGTTRYKSKQELERELEKERQTPTKTKEEEKEKERRIKLWEKLIERSEKYAKPDEALQNSIEDFQKAKNKLRPQSAEKLAKMKLDNAEKDFAEGKISEESVKKAREVFSPNAPRKFTNRPINIGLLPDPVDIDFVPTRRNNFKGARQSENVIDLRNGNPLFQFIEASKEGDEETMKQNFEKLKTMDLTRAEKLEIRRAWRRVK